MSEPVFQIRAAEASDVAGIAGIQTASPEASQWPPDAYLRYETHVAVAGLEVLGFVACRTIAPGEHEILNIAVTPAWRRRGIARELVETVRKAGPGIWFLEVRQSNRAARRLYGSMGFTDAGIRRGYYDEPREPGIVMRFHS